MHTAGGRGGCARLRSHIICRLGAPHLRGNVGVVGVLLQRPLVVPRAPHLLVCRGLGDRRRRLRRLPIRQDRRHRRIKRGPGLSARARVLRRVGGNEEGQLALWHKLDGANEVTVLRVGECDRRYRLVRLIRHRQPAGIGQAGAHRWWRGGCRRRPARSLPLSSRILAPFVPSLVE